MGFTAGTLALLYQEESYGYALKYHKLESQRADTPMKPRDPRQQSL